MSDQISPNHTQGNGIVENAEQLLLKSADVSYWIAEKPAEYRQILKLRKKVFVEEEKYPKRGYLNGYERESTHLIAKIGDQIIGAISVTFDSQKGIYLDKFFDLRSYRNRKTCEFDKLAVLKGERKREVSFQLMWLAYSVIKFCGYQRMFLFSVSSKAENIGMYEKFGFQKIGTFELYKGASAVAFKGDIEECLLEQKFNAKEMLSLGRKLFRRFKGGSQK